MDVLFWIALGISLFGFWLYRLKVPSLDSLVDRAIRQNDLSSVVKAIEARREKAQPAAYNRAIRRMWDGYQRKQAVELVKELVKNFPSVPISQYWIRQVLTVEPVMAKKGLSKQFLDTYYKPEVAARCGPVG
jgi:hypothetical protein